MGEPRYESASILDRAVCWPAGCADRGSEELMGIAIYPGSKVEPAFTDTIRKGSPGSTCYQTVDGLAKVVDF